MEPNLAEGFTRTIESGQPFLGADAVSARLLSSRGLRSRRFRRLWVNVYVLSDTEPSLRQRCIGAQLVLPNEAAISHQTSMEVLDVPTRRADDVHISVPAWVTVPARRPGMITHRREHMPTPFHRDGLNHAPPVDTWLDLAPVLGRDELVCLGDAIVHAGLATPQDFIAGVGSRSDGRRGVLKARAVVGQIRQGSDSPPETTVRLLLVRSGLPEPVLNVDVFDTHGEWLARPDLSYPQWLIAIEYEGAHHLLSKKQWQRDTGRDAAMQAAGWTVLRFTAEDLANPKRIVTRVRAAIANRAA